MSDIKKLVEVLRKMNQTDGTILPGTVDKVNGDTVDVNVGGVVFFDVRLKANDAAKGLKVKPAVGSTVLIGQVGDDKSRDYSVLMYSQADEQLLEIDTVKLLIDKNGFQLSKGTDTQWLAVKLLFEALEPIMILQGNNPDFVKLNLSKSMFKRLFNGT